jgi:hypothetical protein
MFDYYYEKCCRNGSCLRFREINMNLRDFVSVNCMDDQTTPVLKQAQVDLTCECGDGSACKRRKVSSGTVDCTRTGGHIVWEKQISIVQAVEQYSLYAFKCKRKCKV